MDRSNHYESAFEGWLQAHDVCYVGVDESRRCVLGGMRTKNLDFIVHGPEGARLVVDVKGRRFPSGKPGRLRRVWETWSTREDVDGLVRWAESFGAGYQGLLVFAYHVHRDIALAEDTPDLFEWRERRYLFRAVDVIEYSRHMIVRSASWDTVCVPRRVFRDMVQPVSSFVHGFALVPAECPF
jgi:hypothetical protein